MTRRDGKPAIAGKRGPAGPAAGDLTHVTGSALERALVLACGAQRWELAETIAGVLAVRAGAIVALPPERLPTVRALRR